MVQTENKPTLKNVTLLGYSNLILGIVWGILGFTRNDTLLAFFSGMGICYFVADIFIIKSRIPNLKR